ncbi:MAG: hypothetical protein KQI81_08950 [Deltaproteobacteria bacterium]|nr:hypothetical protein [Deltaproteobacteria bacterium]
MRKAAWIWKIKDVYGGDPALIAAKAKAAGFTDVYIKVADGGYTYNITDGVDKCPATVAALKAVGIKVWGWHYVYGYYPSLEVAAAVKRIGQLGLDGYILDAEVEYKNRPTQASTLCSGIKNAYPKLPMALASFRFPSYHPEFPWRTFLSACTVNMPQVYWQAAHNAGDQLQRSFDEFAGLNKQYGLNVPFEPVAAVYSEHGWTPTADEEKDFIESATRLSLPGLSFYCWDDALLQGLSDQWKVAEDFQKVIAPPPQPVDTENLETVINLLADVISDIGKAAGRLSSSVDLLKKLVR